MTAIVIMVSALLYITNSQDYSYYFNNENHNPTNNMTRIPTPIIMILKWDDCQIVPALLQFIPRPTEEFFYGKCYPVFKSLYSRYYTDSAEITDFIHDIYVDIMIPKDAESRCKLDQFSYRCALHNWVGVVSIRFCYAKYKKRIMFVDGDINDPVWVSINHETIFEPNMMASSDFRKILDMMSSERYRKLILLRYVYDYSNEETAKTLGMTMENYYNTHRRARVQFISTYKNEMDRKEARHA